MTLSSSEGASTRPTHPLSQRGHAVADHVFDLSLRQRGALFVVQQLVHCGAQVWRRFHLRGETVSCSDRRAGAAEL